MSDGHKPTSLASGTVWSRRQLMMLLQGQVQTMLDRMAEGVLFMTSSGQILLANAASRRLLGLPDRAADGARLWEFVQHPVLEQLVESALNSQQPHMRELTVSVPDERILQVQVMSSEGSAAESTVSIVLHDVTELRRLERIRQDFVANVSHELRTPLTSIKGFIETLLHGAIDDPGHSRRFLALVEEDVNRLARLTDDLLELAKVESFGKPKTIQSVDVRQITCDVVESLKPQIHGKRIAVDIAAAAPVPAALGDPDQIQQVLWNLLDNAIKYNTEGGRVNIALRAVDGWLTVRVADTGIGIPPDDLVRIFERFYRVDKARSRALGGTGLGLSIVKHIIEAHGGQVDVSSRPGSGSTFQFTLPTRPL